MSGFAKTVECGEISPPIEVVVQGEFGCDHAKTNCGNARRVTIREGWKHQTPRTVCVARLVRETGKSRLTPDDLPNFVDVRCYQVYFV